MRHLLPPDTARILDFILCFDYTAEKWQLHNVKPLIIFTDWQFCLFFTKLKIENKEREGGLLNIISIFVSQSNYVLFYI